MPSIEAVTVYEPAIPFALNGPESATPTEPTPKAVVCTVMVFVPFEKVPLGPLDGAVNVTVAPPTRLGLISMMSNIRPFGKNVFTVVLWELPRKSKIADPTGATTWVIVPELTL
jgi:hypothetical protein